jgi:DNA-binding NtrC family response regulator
VEDDSAIRFGIARRLVSSGFEVDEAESLADARMRYRAVGPQAVVTDYCLPDGDALELITELRGIQPSLPIFVLTGFGSIELAVRAVKAGADDFLTKPVDLDGLVSHVQSACSRTAASASGPRRALPRFGQSPRMLALEDEIARLKDARCSILVLGETGTGKTMLARRLHEASQRRDQPFVDLNCAGLAPDLVESELFGHERGAFTSAHAAKPGVFELADGGTLFLDEIGDIGPGVQPRVLKAIEEKRFRRIGAVRERNVDVRVIAATHRDLRESVRAGAFRADLYYRLATVTITIPPLRERPTDIPFLARDLLRSIAGKMGREVPELGSDAEAALAAHAWPGNIRELKNVLERALHFADAVDVLHAGDLRIDDPRAEDPISHSTTLDDLERAHIERALAAHGSVTEAARSLGISRSSLYLKLKAYGVQPPRGSVPRIKLGDGRGS